MMNDSTPKPPTPEPATTSASTQSAVPLSINPPQIVVRQRGVFSRFFSWLGWLGLLLCLPMLFSMGVSYREYFNTTGGIQEKYHSLNKIAKDKVAIIEVVGTIARGERGYVKKQIDRVRDDQAVKAIVLRVNSPGGTVSASDYILHHLNKLREDRELPVVVSMGGMAASGGYYVAMAVGDQGDTIFAEPTTTTGSIGVIVPHYNISGLMEEFNVVDDSVVSNPRKQLLSMTRPVNEEHRQIIQDYVDESFGQFFDIVKTGRPEFRENEEALRELATGEIFAAKRAVENGLVDKIGFIEDAIDRAIELAGLDRQSVRAVRYGQRGTLMDAIGLSRADQQPLPDITNLLTPQAYYLFTTLPGYTSYLAN